MAVKASAHITLHSVVDIQASYRYYLLQSSTLAKPSKPTTNPPSGSWDDAEPAYVNGSTNSLYFVDLTVFSNGTFEYSEVSLSTAYEAAKEAYNKAVAAQNSANNAQNAIDNLEIGGRNIILKSKTFEVGSTVDEWQVAASVTENDDGFSQVDWNVSNGAATWQSAISPVYQLPTGWINRKVILSAWVYSDDWSTQDGGIYWRVNMSTGERTADRRRDIQVVNSSSALGAYAHGDAPTNGKWTRIWTEFTLSDDFLATGTAALDTLTHIYVGFYLAQNGSVSMKMPKLEFGTRPTDWCPATEDTDEDIQDAQDTADESLSNSESNTNRLNFIVDSINATLSTLITGENGETLMTQTDTGWTFSLATIQTAIDSALSDIKDMQSVDSDMASTIDVIEQSVADLGSRTEYVHMGTDGGQPCIILGETDSNFRVLITNTDIRFMEGTSVPAYINNQSLYVESAVITKELRQGGFAWIARSNGNYGLVWRGEE